MFVYHSVNEMLAHTKALSFLITTIFVLLGKTCSGLGDPVNTEWWETTLIYRISPSSYQDSDGDGHGDLQGIINRLDYIDDLGVETICLNPIYQAPLVDSSYYLPDYKNIHPIFGNLSDFDELLQEAHERDMKVILDIAPSHSSDQHEWFNASIYRIHPYTDYYIWANGTVTENGTRIPPDNWSRIQDNEVNSPWTWNDQRDQYYHKFDESQPDLNLQNEDVRQEIMLILEFWLDRGVDGFRISDVSYFYEDPELELEKNFDLLYQIRSHVDDWTEATNSTSKLLVAGTCDTVMNSLYYYGRDNLSGIVPLNCRFVIDIDGNKSSNASQIESEIEEWLNLIPSNASTNWMLSNNDNSRIASRVGSDRLDALHMLSMLLPGQAFTYYGDEIGMLDTQNSSNEDIDDIRSDNEYSEGIPTRESATAPMQWDDTNIGGFSTSEDTYFPINDNYLETNVEEQLNDPKSHLNVYKTLARLRKDPVFVRGDWELESINEDAVLVLRRTLTNHPVYLVVINLSDKEQIVNITELYPDLNEYLDVVVTSSNDLTNRSAVSGDAIDLCPFAGLVLKEQENYNDTTESYIDVETTEETSSSDYDEITTEKIETTSFSVPTLPTEISHVTTINPEPTVLSSACYTEFSKLQLIITIGLAITTIAGIW